MTKEMKKMNTTSLSPQQPTTATLFHFEGQCKVTSPVANMSPEADGDAHKVTNMSPEADGDAHKVILTYRPGFWLSLSSNLDRVVFPHLIQWGLG